MKLWIILLVIIVAIVWGGIVIENSILKTTNQLSHELDSLQEHVKANRWDEARRICRGIDHYWSTQRKLWGPFIHNHDLDVIAENLAHIVSLLDSEEKSDVLAEIAVVKVRLVQLHNQEILTLENIF